MEEIINKLNELLVTVKDYIDKEPIDELENKPFLNKWSKKEILGHLIDSGINNLQRFNEVQFQELPYRLRNYHQDKLVKSNFYQKADIEDLLHFWIYLNKRILLVISNLSDAIYLNEVILPSGKKISLKFLIEDYVAHMKHHVNQIIE